MINLARNYAQAIAETKAPDLGKIKSALARRGHEKLLPQIYREYQTLQLQQARSAAHRRTTPQKEKTRILLDLYKKLIA